VATKSDLREDARTKEVLAAKGKTFVTKDQGEALAKKMNARFIECSALTRANLKDVFDAAITAVMTSGQTKVTKAPSGKKSALALPKIGKGIATIELKKAEDLRAADSNGFSDPYVAIHLFTKDAKHDGKLLWKTPHIKKTLNPKWDAKFTYDIDPEKLRGTDGIALQVWDHNLLSAEFLGEVRLEWEDIKSGLSCIRSDAKLDSRLWSKHDDVKGTLDYSITYKS